MEPRAHKYQNVARFFHLPFSSVGNPKILHHHLDSQLLIQGDQNVIILDSELLIQGDQIFQLISYCYTTSKIAKYFSTWCFSLDWLKMISFKGDIKCDIANPQ